MKTYEERMAAVEQKLQRKKTQRKALAVTAGALCLCILTGLFLYPIGRGAQDNPGQASTGPIFVQNPNSEYSRVIQALQKYDQEHQNDLDQDFVYGGEVPEVAPPTATPNGDTSTGNSAVDVTDNQVAGVEEGDLIKRSQTHIFYLKTKKLEVYPIAGEDTQMLGGCYVDTDLPDYTYYRNEEMYLSQDATRLTIIGSGSGFLFAEQNYNFLQITSVDVSDPANVRVLDSVLITGALTSSRIVGDKLLLVAQYSKFYKTNYGDITTFIPHYGTAEQMEPVPVDSIILPDTLENAVSTMVFMLDTRNLQVLDSKTLMSYSSQMYVSAENIYVTRNYTKEIQPSEAKIKGENLTDITCIGYTEDGLTVKRTFTVEGRVKNQYSMDEYEGIFRIVTTTSGWEVDLLPGGYQSIPRTIPSNANLYCFEVGTWEQKALVERFAPDGETAESVRFDGPYAYVCTAKVVVLTDPVFFFDLTDLNNITVKDTGTIDGYSSSLIQLKDGYLMGIGFDNNRSLKVEIYAQAEDGVISVCTYGGEVAFAFDYKAYYIDRENNIFGIPTSNGYVLLYFTGFELVELVRTEPIATLDSTRGLIVDGCLYVFSNKYFYVKDLAKL